jgi:cytochrome c oxidase subunit 2
VKWSFDPKPAALAQGVACCDFVNRGAAFADGRLFFNTLDGQTIAVEAETGRANETTLVADREGRFRGQCAEFCGFQHANMALDVVAMPRDRFDAWRAAQLAPAPPPGDELQERGRQVFLSSACVMCHTIHGTSAASRVGPDLTHVAGRLSLAAGTLPYGKGNLAGWIADPQRIKPGTQMPITDLSPDQLQSVVAYLDSLK